MIWFFATVVLLLLVGHPGFRRFALVTAGVGVAAVVIALLSR